MSYTFKDYRFLQLRSLILIALFFGSWLAAQIGSISGSITTPNGLSIGHVSVVIENTDYAARTDANGRYSLRQIPYGTYKIDFIFDEKIQHTDLVHLRSHAQKLDVVLPLSDELIQEVLITKTREIEKRKLDDITRLPVDPDKLIQSVYVLDDQLIQDIGALGIAQVTDNVSGVYTFSTFGGVRESMSIRGFRGVPIMKNGILISKDTGGRGFATDFEGVESVQVIKGADAINMGSSTSYGSAGGVINLVTKTPEFVEKGKVSMRVGSFNLVRPTFDVQTLLGRKQNAAFRLDGAYETSRTYQNIKNIGKESIYFNPSFAFKPDDKTDIVLEMDYYNNSNTFDPGTVNMAPGNDVNELYHLPKKQFLGFEGNNTLQKMTTAALRLKRQLTPKLYLRAAAFLSDYDTSGPSAKLTPVKANPDTGVNVDKRTVFTRALERSKEHNDKYTTVQIDLIGDHVKTGSLEHTFQAGVDFKRYKVEERKFKSIAVDEIDITQPITNHKLPTGLGDFGDPTSVTKSTTNSIGFSAQEMLEIANRVTLTAGVRIGSNDSYTPGGLSSVRSNYVNPLVGATVRLFDDFKIFGSYATTTDPSTAEFPDKDGNPLGNETFKQFETGIKSTWFKKRLRADLVYYRIDNDGMNVQQTIVDENGISQALGYYFKGGHIRYQGLEFDVIGKVSENLSLSAGFAKMEAKYLSSDQFWIGSSPKNIPDFTAHAYANYTFRTTGLRGLSLGAGYYYIGERPYNDWTQFGVDYHGIEPGLKPWIVKSYSTVNAQIGYDFKYANNPTLRNFQARLIFNNLGDTVGYNTYRDRNINRISPRNMSLIVSYNF